MHPEAQAEDRLQTLHQVRLILHQALDTRRDLLAGGGPHLESACPNAASGAGTDPATVAGLKLKEEDIIRVRYLEDMKLPSLHQLMQPTAEVTRIPSSQP